MVGFLESHLLSADRRVREIERVYDAIVSLAQRDDAPKQEVGNSQRRLWKPSDIPTASMLASIVEGMEEALQAPLLRSNAERKILPVKKADSSSEFQDAKHRFALARCILSNEDKLRSIDSAAAKQAMNGIECLKEEASSKIYYSVTRRYNGRRFKKNIYKNIVMFYTIGGGISVSGIKNIKKDLEDTLATHLEIKDFSVEVIKQPQFSVAGPRGHFHQSIDRLRPGMSLKSPGGMWSSLCCLARDRKTEKVFAVCSGHGATDYFFAELGDTLARPVGSNSDQPVAILAHLPQSLIAPEADFPIIDFDFALAEVMRPETAENVLDDSAAPQRVTSIRGFESKEFDGRSVAVSKVGAMTQRQNGSAHNNRSVVTVVDQFGNASILLDQIEVRKIGNAFSKFGDSGGLLFEDSPADLRSVIGLGGVSASGGASGKANVTFCSPIKEFLDAHNLELLGEVSA